MDRGRRWGWRRNWECSCTYSWLEQHGFELCSPLTCIRFGRVKNYTWILDYMGISTPNPCVVQVWKWCSDIICILYPAAWPGPSYLNSLCLLFSPLNWRWYFLPQNFAVRNQWGNKCRALRIGPTHRKICEFAAAVSCVFACARVHTCNVYTNSIYIP